MEERISVERPHTTAPSAIAMLNPRPMRRPERELAPDAWCVGDKLRHAAARPPRVVDVYTRVGAFVVAAPSAFSLKSVDAPNGKMTTRLASSRRAIPTTCGPQ